jgi:hypothetical protein
VFVGCSYDKTYCSMDVGSVKFLFPVMVFWCSLRCVVVETQWMAVGSSILLFVIPGVYCTAVVLL